MTYTTVVNGAECTVQTDLNGKVGTFVYDCYKFTLRDALIAAAEDIARQLGEVEQITKGGYALRLQTVHNLQQKGKLDSVDAYLLAKSQREIAGYERKDPEKAKATREAWKLYNDSKDTGSPGK